MKLLSLTTIFLSVFIPTITADVRVCQFSLIPKYSCAVADSTYTYNVNYTQSNYTWDFAGQFPVVLIEELAEGCTFLLCSVVSSCDGEDAVVVPTAQCLSAADGSPWQRYAVVCDAAAGDGKGIGA